MRQVTGAQAGTHVRGRAQGCSASVTSHRSSTVSGVRLLTGCEPGFQPRKINASSYCAFFKVLKCSAVSQRSRLYAAGKVCSEGLVLNRAQPESSQPIAGVRQASTSRQKFGLSPSCSGIRANRAVNSPAICESGEGEPYRKPGPVARACRLSPAIPRCAAR